MSQLLLQEYLMKFAELQGLSQWNAMMAAVRNEHPKLPSLKAPFAAYLRSLDEEGARQALKHLEAIP